MRCVVTGAAGFIGSHLSEYLCGQGHDVIGIDSFTDYYDPALKRSNVDSLASMYRFELVQADVASATAAACIVEADVVFHLAGQPGVRASWDASFAVYAERNIVATQALLEAARRSSRVKRIVYASSSSVYGNQVDYPCLETTVPEPFSPYGVTKLAGEHLCRLYAANYGLPTVALRYFTVYGPRQRPDMAFSRFLSSALNRNPLTVTGDGTQIRDFTFVADVVRATVAAGQLDLPAGQVINVSGSESVTVNEVLRTLQRVVGTPIAVRHVPPIPGDVYRTGGSTDRAADLLDWIPRVDLETGLRAQAAWRKTTPKLTAATLVPVG